MTMFVNGEKVHLSEYSIHDVGSVLKKAFRDLGEPICTTQLYQMFLDCSKYEEISERLNALKHTISLLPERNKRILRKILTFLGEIVFHSNANKMNSLNLALVWGPAFFFLKNQSPESIFVETNFITSVTETIIVHQSHLLD